MYSIGEISKIVNLSIDALRYYDEIGLLKPVRIEPSNRYRYYSEEQIDQLLFIMELKQFGFGLDAIRELLKRRDSMHLQAAFRTKLQEMSAAHAAMEQSMKSLKRRITEMETQDQGINPKNVLIVDDAAFMRQMVRKIVEDHGYKVVGEAANGREGIEQYEKTSPDVVIMDIGMPESDGIAAAKTIKGLAPNAKILFCSAQGRLKRVLEAVEAGASGFVVKPFYVDAFMEALSGIWEAKAPFRPDTVKALLDDRRVQEESSEEAALSQARINELLLLCTLENGADRLEQLLNRV